MLDATAKGMDMNDKEHVSFRHSAKVVILQEAEWLTYFTCLTICKVVQLLVGYICEQRPTTLIAIQNPPSMIGAAFKTPMTSHVYWLFNRDPYNSFI